MENFVRHRFRSGFTLFELAIVLVIIGLVVGGIVVGQNMIRSSELQTVISEVSQITQAAQNFRDKYGELPGDFSGAEALWGTASGGCPTGAGTGTQTCNGDGNGIIDHDCNGSSEDFRAWQHLANAGMLQGYYTGVSGPGSGWEALPGINIPGSRISGGGYEWHSNTNEACLGHPWSYYFFDPYNTNAQFLSFGAQKSADDAQNPILTPAEALNLDTKLDDGIPGTGKFTVPKPGTDMNPIPMQCATTTDPTTAQYNTSDSNIECTFIIRYFP